MQRRNDAKVKRDFMGSEIGALSLMWSAEYLKDFPDYSKDSIIALYDTLMESMFRINQAENEHLGFREEFTRAIKDTAECMVLGNSRDDLVERGVDLPYLSGELYEHLVDLVPHSHILTQGCKPYPDTEITQDWLLKVLEPQMARAKYLLEGLDFFRVKSGDYNKERDWMHPFLRACMITQEHEFREALGMPSLFPESGQPLYPMRYALFQTMVLGLEADPLASFEAAWNDTGDDTPHYLVR